MSLRSVAFRAVLLATAAAVPLTVVAQTSKGTMQASTADIIRVLLDQSSYWRGKSENKLADEALARVLSLDPNNIDALALQAQAAAERGDTRVATDALAKLKAARPEDPRIANIQQSLRIGPVDQSSLTEARRFAQAGKPAEALAAYRRVFKGDVPPPSLATEFYQTLGATEGNWEVARDGLATHLRADPQDLQAQLAYAELLTYRDETRDNGVQRLSFLTREAQLSAQADRAWRQALSWLPATQSSVAKYDQYLAHAPNDTEVQRWRGAASADTGSLRAAGFDDLTGNRTLQAEAAFTKAIAVDGRDSDALIGLALVRFKQNRKPEGRDLIRKAIEIDPTKAAQYQSMLTTTGIAAGGQNGGNAGGRANGNGRNDFAAASGRKIRGEYAEVAALTNRGEFGRAEALLRKLMGNRPNAGNYLQLGDIQARAGRLGESESSFRTVLRSQPRNVAALSGLAGVLTRDGKTTDAEQVFRQAQAYGGGNASGQSRAQMLRQQAQNVSDPTVRTGLFQSAVAADPSNPWLRLELARSLATQDREADARRIMAGVTDGANPSVDQLRAGIYFAASDHQDRLASTLVGRLPPRARTPEMLEIASRSDVAADVQDAQSQPNAAAVEQRMVALAAKPDPTGGRAAAFAQELTRIGDRPGARAVIRAALAANPAPTAQQRIAYAGALVGAGFPRDAKIVTAGLGAGGLNPLQRSNLTTVQDDAAVSAADALNARGQTTEALTELRPRLTQDPANPALNMALARVYTAQKQPAQALAITNELLKRNPNDAQVQVAAVSAALAAGNVDRASELAKQLTTAFPDEPQGWYAAGQVAKSRGETGNALAAFKKARDLRARQLSSSDASDVLIPGWEPGRRYALLARPDVMNDASPVLADPVTREYEQYHEPAPAMIELAQLDPASGPVPFRSFPLTVPPIVNVRAGSVTSPLDTGRPFQTAQQSDLGSAQVSQPSTPLRTNSSLTLDEPSTGSSGVGPRTTTGPRIPSDPLTADIDRNIDQLSADLAPEMSASVSVRGRSGSRGLSKLFDFETPLEASFSPGGYGRLKVQVTPTFIQSGQPAGSSKTLFGTNPIAVAATPFGQLIPYGRSPTTNSSGAALDVSYAYDFVTVDVGATPIGFQQSQVVGGIQFAPRLTNDLLLRVNFDRRAVTDSVLSFAGQRDGRTGEKWGGVTRNRAYAQFEGSVFGDTYYYVGGGTAAFLGQEVKANRDIEAQAGFSTPIYKDSEFEVRAGANLSYFGFKRNLGNFTLGNGGYFSPQQYIAALFPVTFKHQVTPDLVYDIGGSIGVQNFRAKSELVFPRDGGLQQQLVQLAATTGSFAAKFPGFHGTGLAGGASADIDYRVTNNLHIGAKVGADRSGNFTEGTGLFYARYTFNDPQ